MNMKDTLSKLRDDGSFTSPQAALTRLISTTTGSPVNKNSHSSTIAGNAIDSKVRTIKNERTSYYRTLDSLYENDLCRTIIDVMSDDILRDTSQKIMISVSVPDNEEYDEELNALFDRLSIPDLVDDIIGDYLYFGEYSVGIRTEEGEGVVKILDNYESRDVIGIYDGRIPVAFYCFNSNTNSYDYVHPSRMIHFINTSKKIRINAGSGPIGKAVSDIIESPVIRSGRSVIWSAKDKIQELIMKEKSRLAACIASYSRPSMVGINLPVNMSASDMNATVNKYEDALNTLPDIVNPGSQISVSDLISKTSRVKVLPNIGGDKGSLNKISLNDELKDQSGPDDIRQDRSNILSCLGIPPELVLDQAMDGKRSTLKKYGRYNRRIKAHQRSISRALRYMCVTHLAIKYNDENISESDVEVTLYNPSNLEEIEDLEGTELAVNSLSQVTTSMSTLNTTLSELAKCPWIDKLQLVMYAKKILGDSGSGAQDIIDLEAYEKFTDLEKQSIEDGSIPDPTDPMSLSDDQPGGPTPY